MSFSNVLSFVNEGLAGVGVGEEVKMIVLTAARAVLERRMMATMLLLLMELRDRIVMFGVRCLVGIWYVQVVIC
jgi:hypothetical protein